MHHMDDLGSAIRSFLRHEGVDQATLASRAKISQSTVSRAIHRQPQRNSKAYARLVRFMQQNAILDAKPDPALDALQDIWDGSAEHAAALASLIHASRELWPNLREDKADD